MLWGRGLLRWQLDLRRSFKGRLHVSDTLDLVGGQADEVKEITQVIPHFHRSQLSSACSEGGLGQ